MGTNQGYVTRNKLLKARSCADRAKAENRVLKRRLKLLQEYTDALSSLRFSKDQIPEQMTRLRLAKAKIDRMKKSIAKSQAAFTRLGD